MKLIGYISAVAGGSAVAKSGCLSSINFQFESRETSCCWLDGGGGVDEDFVLFAPAV